MERQKKENTVKFTKEGKVKFGKFEVGAGDLVWFLDDEYKLCTIGMCLDPCAIIQTVEKCPHCGEHKTYTMAINSPVFEESVFPTDTIKRKQ